MRTGAIECVPTTPVCKPPTPGTMLPLVPATARRVVGLAFLSLLLIGPSIAQQRPVSLDDFVDASSAVVIGRAIGQQSGWDASGKRIVTRVRFAVDETVVGEDASELELVIPGGRVGNVVQEVSHMPVFADGEETLLFVWTAPDGRKMTVGGHQGKFEVVRGPDGSREIRGLGALMRDSAPGRPDVPPGSAVDRVPLDLALERIRAARD